MSFLKSVLHENQWTCILRIGRSCIIANQFHSVEYPFWSFTWKPIDMHTVKTSQKFKTFHINITRSDKYASILLISFCFEPPILMKKKNLQLYRLGCFADRCFLISLIVLVYSLERTSQSLIWLSLVVSQDYI